MEAFLEKVSVSRKRRSRSNSPSEDIAEHNLKKKRFDTDEEITNEQTSLKENSVNCSIDVERDSVSVIKEKIETLEKQERKYCNNESKIQTNKEKADIQDKMEVSTEQKEKSDTETTDKNPNITDDKTIINIAEETSEDSVKLEGMNEGLLENNKNYEDKLVSESEEKITEEAPTLTSDTDEDTIIDKEKLSKPLDHTPTKKINQETPNKKLTPKQIQKKLEAEKRNQEKQKDRDERMKKKLEEKERIIQEKLKKKEMKEKEIELKKKERDEKEEKKKKEREEKEQKRKEKEEKEEQRRKEKEQEKQKKLQEMEEKNKEKLKEEEKKQKAVAAFVNFFVPKKSEESQDDRRVHTSNFLDFEVKSDMKLPLPRRETLSIEEKEKLEDSIRNQNEKASYLKDISSGKQIGKSLKTWPYEETIDDDVIVVDLGETICEDKPSLQRHRAKFLYFHDNRRPAYYGTWRKKSKFVSPRKPFGEDKSLLNYEEDSDDDWEEEEQGESLNGSEDEADKEIEDEKDDYEVDNEFFVPHGHLSDDEVDDEEMARLSPDSLKQKLKLLKEEFDQDIKSKTLKLKPRSIGCIWYNKEGTNVEDPVDRYLQPLAIITTHIQIIIKSRIDIASLAKEKKNKVIKELDPELVPSLLKLIHGSSKKKIVLVEQFLSENQLNYSKGFLLRQFKQCAIWEKYKDEETKRCKFRWFVHQELREKYNLV